MSNLLSRKKSGNILIIAVVALLAAVIIGTSLIKSAADVTTIASNMDATMRVYDDIAVENLIALSFKEDIAGWTGTHDTVPLAKDFTWEAYTEVVKAIQSSEFNTNEDGTIVYKENNIETIAQNTGIRANTPSKIAERLKVIATRLGEYTLTIDRPIALDEGSDQNELLFKSGDTCDMKDINLTITMQDGASDISQTYRISGLKIAFVGSTFGIRGTVIDDDATLSLIRQNVT